MLAVCLFVCFFFFNDTATTEIYTLSLHDALPIYASFDLKALRLLVGDRGLLHPVPHRPLGLRLVRLRAGAGGPRRSEEHTSELQSRQYLVCRLLLEKKKKNLKTLHRRYRIADYVL